jgi:RNA polymerase II subunit A small phosphatase-like protein
MESTSTDKLLVLDLDETLIHATEGPLTGRAAPADFRVGRWHVYKRPHVDAFLAGCRARFARVGVWTSASPGYAAGVVANLFPDRGDWLSFVWAADRCTPRYDHETCEWVSCKDVAKLRRRLRVDPRTVIAVDDSPEKHRAGYGNLVRVRPFLGDPADDELPALLAYLDRLRHVPNVRAIEKRDWRRGLRNGVPPGGVAEAYGLSAEDRD